MKQNGKNIIFDEDITMTGSNLGEKLSDIVGELQSKTSELESNVKYLYEYGGVGGNGGGSGSSDTDFVLYATLGDIQINGTNIILGSTGTYDLSFKIQRPNGASFKVVFKYSTVSSSGTTVAVSDTVTLDVNNSYTYSKSIVLNNNDTISVTATDSVYNVTKQVSANYITKSYNFSSYLANNSKENLGSEIFVSTAKSNGLVVFLDYEIAVTATTTYSLSFNTGTKIITTDGTISKDSKTGTVKIDLIELGSNNGWVVSDSSSGYYSIVLDVSVSVEGQLTKTTSNTITFTLVPEGLYLLVQPTVGNIYTNEPTDTTGVYKYTAGFITFNVKAYYGQSSDSACTIKYYLYDEENSPVYTTINTTLRELSVAKIYSTKPGLGIVKFSLTCNGVSYPSSNSYGDGYIPYYFYVKEVDSEISWPWGGTSSRVGTYNYYRGTDYGGSTSAEGVKAFQSLYDVAGGSPYQQTATKEPFSISDIYYPSTTSVGYNTVVSLGIQYSEINTEPYSTSNLDGSVIFTGYKTTGATSETLLIVTQNKVKIGSSVEISYYLPKTLQDNFGNQNQFHLLTISSRLIKTVSTTTYYEVLVYVDGIIEGSASGYTTNLLNFDKVVIGSTNSYINLIEVSYPNTEYKTKSVGGETVVTEESNSEDLKIYQYYLKYRNILLGQNISSDEKNIMSYCSNFDIQNEGRVTCSDASISSLAMVAKIPTIVFTIQDDNGTVLGELEKGYSEEESVNTYKTTVQWSIGNGETLSEVSVPDTYSNAYFSIKPQGTSTKSYKCKNYTLSLNNSNQSETAAVYLFSPNYKTTDTSTFLPEESFTLKADVVDSSHSNNTSLGKFINKVTSKFSTESNGVLSGYVKNCLDGFPILVYIRLASKDTVTGNTTYTNYYQGVYNFNLGRESFYNLGYKDSNVFCDSTGNSLLTTDAGTTFKFWSISKDQDKFKDGLIVAEVQGNKPFFDFSQWDPTILYKTYSNIENEPYMFGDIVTGSGLSETQAQSVIKNFVKQVSLSGGYIYGNNLLKKRFSNTKDDLYGYNNGYNARITIGDVEVPANQVPNYRKHFTKTMPSGITTWIASDTDDPEGTIADLVNLIGDPDNDINGWIDFQSLSEYYTICMAFGMVDSVQKNLNIKTWKGDPNTGYGKFYAAFYDMDTCLGINNAGADVSYSAFSDFWSFDDSNVSADGKTVTPTAVTIYRDYSPRTTSSDTEESASDYYDTPSSYLFAIVKYAKYLSSLNQDIIAQWPKQLWAKWRASVTSTNDPSVGCLSSAEEFMSTYFSNNLGSVSAPLINMDYRNKYLVLGSSGTTFSTRDFGKFNGTRIAKTTDWLRGRLHILDAYFNLPSARSIVQYYDENNNYVDITTTIDGSVSYLAEPALENTTAYLLENNSDIIVLRDIFASSGTESNQGSGDLNINITTKSYSPLFVNTANESYRYLFGGGDVTYNINVALNGTQTYNFFGSSAWTSLDSINSFNFYKLFINSKYLETLSGTSKKSMSITGSNVIMPSLKELILTGPNYTGNFTSDGSITGTRYPNLKSVNLSNTSLSAKIDQSMCSSVNISNMTSSSVSITSCTNISTITLGTGSSTTPCTTINSLTITPIPLSLCKTTSTSNSSGGFTMNYSAVGVLTVSNIVNTEATVDGNVMGYSRVSVTNDSQLTTLNVTGIAQIYVYNCPKLQYIYITEPEENGGKFEGDHLSQIYIDNCGYNTTSDLKIGDSSTAEGIVDLRKYSYLRKCRISNITKITEVHFNENANSYVDLLDSAFYGDTSLKYVSGSLINITGTNTFNYARSYTLRSKADSDAGEVYPTPLFVKQSITNLSGTFCCSNGGSIDLVAANEFINGNHWGNKSAVTNISYMFYGQSIKYSEEQLKSDLAGKSSLYLDMSGFTKVSNVVACFAYNNISAWHKKMFSFGTDSSITSISFESYARTGTREISTTIDLLSEIISKVDILWWNTGGSDDYPILKFINSSSGSALSTVSLKDFFHPGGSNPINIGSLQYISFSSSNSTIDFNGVFDSNNSWKGLTYINRFLYDRDYTNLANIEGMFKNVTKIYEFHDSIRISNTNNPVNLFNFVNWASLIVASKGRDPFTSRSDSEWSYSLGCFNVKKYITDSDFSTLLAILKSSSLTGISHIFKTCTLYTVNGLTTKIDFPGEANTSIKTLNSTFDEFKIVSISNELNSDSNPVTNHISDEDIYVELGNIYTTFPNVTSSAYTFRGMKISTSIPYNFFNKRTVTATSVYVKTGTIDSSITYYPEATYGPSGTNPCFTAGTLYKYSYKRVLTNLRSCFINVKWKQDYSLAQPVDARCFSEPESPLDGNCISLSTGTTLFDSNVEWYIIQQKTITNTNSDGELVITYEGYYSKQGKIREGTENSEITDLKWYDYEGKVKQSEHIDSFNKVVDSSTTYKFTNFPVRADNISNLFIAPDIFYGCAESCDIDSFFSNDNDNEETLEGVFPNNLLKNCKSTRLTNTFKNLNITPRYYWTTKSTKEENKVFYYIPSNFTDAPDLSYAFNFHLQIPASSQIIAATNVTTFSTYYLMLSDSLNPSKLTSLLYAFPSVSYSKNGAGLHVAPWPNFGLTAGGTEGVNFGIHYNIMYTPSVTTATDGSVIYSGEDGIDMSKYSKLALDELIPGNLACFLYGRLFKTGFALQNMKKAIETSYVIRTYMVGTNTSSISMNCNLPAAKGNFNAVKFFQFDATTFHIKASQVDDGNSDSVSAYKTMKDGNKLITVEDSL